MISPWCVRISSPTTTRHGSRSASCNAPLMRVVVGDAHDVEAALDHGDLDLLRRRGAVTAPHRVGVQVDAHPARLERRGEVGVARDRSR